MSTRIISTSEFRGNQKKYLDLAEKERIVIKRGRNLIILTVAEKVTDVNKTWFDDFFSIPEKYRCNPFDYSPSGDLFYADIRNVEHVKSAIERANKGESVRIGTKEELKSFLDKL